MKKNKKPTVLVTGAAGFIGSFVTDELVKMGMNVVAMDDLSGGFRQNVHPRATFVRGSVQDRKLIEKLFARHKFKYVYHLAAYAAEGLSHFIKRFNYENNLIGSVNLINASVNHGVKCFVFTSSIAVYGPNQLPMTESLVPQPEDPYGIAKLSVEYELHATQRLFGLDYVIFRPHNVYGERQNIGDRYRNVIGIFMNQILRKEPLSIFGDGRQTRAFTHVADVAPGIAKSVFVKKAYGQVFNIGADKPYSVNTLVKQVCAAMGAPNHPVRHFPERSEVKHAYSDHSKAKKILSISPRIALDEGLFRMAEWVRRHGSRTSRDFGKIEIEKNLPSAWKKASR